MDNDKLLKSLEKLTFFQLKTAILSLSSFNFSLIPKLKNLVSLISVWIAECIFSTYSTHLETFSTSVSILNGEHSRRLCPDWLLMISASFRVFMFTKC